MPAEFLTKGTIVSNFYRATIVRQFFCWYSIKIVKILQNKTGCEAVCAKTSIKLFCKWNQNGKKTQNKDNHLATKHTHLFGKVWSIIPDIPEVTALETSASCTLLPLFGPVCRSTAKDYSSKCRSTDWLIAALKEKVYKSHSITLTAFHNFTTESVKVVCSHSPLHKEALTSLENNYCYLSGYDLSNLKTTKPANKVTTHSPI